MNSLEKAFAKKKTENGDVAYSTTGNNLLDILFMSEYYQNHLDKVHIGQSDREKLFSMFIRDPRLGMGRRDLGRVLMQQSGCSAKQVVFAGRFDDLYKTPKAPLGWLTYLIGEAKAGNQLAKKWMPRYSSKNFKAARVFASFLGMNKQEYGHFVKCNTVENQMSRNQWDEIKFEHVPSLASIKYAMAFQKHQSERYNQYLQDVRSGKKELHVATTNVYDIYKNRNKIDSDLFFSKIEKTQGSWIPIVDTSGSMQDSNDSFGKACAIGHYLAKCSTYCPNQVLSFSSYPKLITLGKFEYNQNPYYWKPNYNKDSQYETEIASMYTGDCSNTDFGKVMKILGNLEKDYPEYLIVLSDMEFDQGSNQKKDQLMNSWKSQGIRTKIIWWNFNSRNTTCPEIDSDGNIFLSGYNPTLLKYLECGFDGNQFLEKLLSEYSKNITL